MEDIYDEHATSDFIDGAVGGAMMGKFIIDNSDPAPDINTDASGHKLDYSASWKKFAPPTKGFGGVIALISRLVFIVVAAASIVMLIVSGFINGFNF